MTKAIARRHNEIQRWRESREREGRREDFAREMGELFCDKSTNLQDFSLRRLAEALIPDGREFVQNYLDPTMDGGFRMQEAADVVASSMFANIIGQYAYAATLQSYQMPELIGDQLVTVVQTPFNGEKIPGITPIGDQIELIQEGQPYPHATVGEKWVDTPETTKRGLLIDVTKEAVFLDRTSQLLSTAGDVGMWLAINREKRILDCVVGATTTYKRNGAAAVATYGLDNTKSSNPLVDYTSLDAVDTLMAAMTDPDTGEPIVWSPDTVIVPPALRNTAFRILNATMTGKTTSTVETRVQNTPQATSLMNTWTALSNQWVKQRTSSDSVWFYGSFKKAFRYMQNWPMTVEQDTSAYESFRRDVVASYKASERGTPAVVERRYVAKSS